MQRKHIAQATVFAASSLTKRHLTSPNTREGFEKLDRWMDGLQQKHRLKGLIIGMEPTGNYGFNLANWLANKGKYVMVNLATNGANQNQNQYQSPQSV